jgi:hypothetical protein
MGWKINLWARFLDGDHAYLILRNLLQPVGGKESFLSHGGKSREIKPAAGIATTIIDWKP